MTVTRLGAVLAFLFTGMAASAEPITTVLSLKGKVTMEELAHNVRNPLSDHYNRYYEPAEIRQLAAPSDAEYNDLISGLKAEGFTIVKESPTHLWVTVSSDVKVVESLFNTDVQMLAPGTHKQMRSARVPFHLSLIKSISGLDTTRKSFPRIVRTHNKDIGTHGNLGGGVQQSTIKTAYGFDPLYTAGLNGSGMHIAIATYDGFRTENVEKYYQLSKLNPMSTVDQVMYNGTPKYDPNSAGETELDCEFSGMLAPGVAVHVFASATNDDPGEVQMFTAILDDNRAKVVNYSWGGCENQVSAQHKTDMEAVFARAVAQGVNIFVASGDSGSDSCGDGTAQADWPAANPNVIAVGGTSFDQQKGVIAETGWNGSGGGISGMWDLPAYQSHLGGIYTKRSYPDVAFNADPYTGQAVYTGPAGEEGFEVIGGTSMAAPQWAGFMALVGQARMKMGKGDLGFFNPILYSMSPADQDRLLHDVTSGNNGAYNAGKSWDAVTGFGSMQANMLLDYLKAL